MLLSNHYHIMIETPEPNLVAGMKWRVQPWEQCFDLKGDRIVFTPTLKYFDGFRANLATNFLHEPI